MQNVKSKSEVSIKLRNEYQALLLDAVQLRGSVAGSILKKGKSEAEENALIEAWSKVCEAHEILYRLYKGDKKR